MHFKIEEPIWKNKAVGLNVNKIEAENLVEVVWKDKQGERLYPFTYKITGARAKTYPTMMIPGKGVRVYVVPIVELEIAH